MKSISRNFWNGLAGLLSAIAIGCGLYAALVAVRSQAMANAADRIITTSAPADRQDRGSWMPAQQALAGSRPSAEVVGRLTIPELKLSVPILSNYQPQSLAEGIGHIPGTAMPGGLGTVGLAGHRDTYFRPLRGIKRDMDIQVGDTTGVYHYAVDSTEIVMPDAVQILDIGSRPELVLITCYPFTYIGAAPKRFIVHAHLVSALPDRM